MTPSGGFFMPRFSIKDLLLATTLIAIGAGLIYWAYSHPTMSRYSDAPNWPLFLGWMGGGAFIGAGVFTPFKKPWIGALVGLAVQILIPLLAPQLH
jgi:hypothetical protein